MLQGIVVLSAPTITSIHPLAFIAKRTKIIEQMLYLQQAKGCLDYTLQTPGLNVQQQDASFEQTTSHLTSPGQSARLLAVTCTTGTGGNTASF
jgi:hypothetical protein